MTQSKRELGGLECRWMGCDVWVCTQDDELGPEHVVLALESVSTVESLRRLECGALVFESGCMQLMLRYR
jgi:hypothetical protein